MAFDQGLIDWVEEAMAPLGTVTLRKPSLDDVFLALTGGHTRDRELEPTNTKG